MKKEEWSQIEVPTRKLCGPIIYVLLVLLLLERCYQNIRSGLMGSKERNLQQCNGNEFELLIFNFFAIGTLCVNEK